MKRMKLPEVMPNSHCMLFASPAPEMRAPQMTVLVVLSAVLQNHAATVMAVCIRTAAPMTSVSWVAVERFASKKETASTAGPEL
jgi:hypothetical protein